MKGKSVFAESRDLAFQTYRECGGNVEKTLRELEKKGLKLSKPTFYKWMEKFNFVERLSKADALTQETNDFNATFEARMLKKLITQLEKYEHYFEENPGLDTQATYAYTNLLKIIIELSRKVKSPDELPAGPVKKAGLSEETLTRIKEELYGITTKISGDK